MAEFNDFQRSIIAALSAKKAEKPCPACGTEDWAIFAEPVPVSMASDAYPLHLTRYVAAVALACTNCGFVRTHTLEALGIEMPKIGIPAVASEETKEEGK